MKQIIIAKQIKAYRKKNRVSQEKFGGMLGVSGQAVSKWEREVCCPDISLLPALAEVLDIPIRELFGEK